MNTKLTLTIEKEVIETAKEYAKEMGQGLTEMVENYFKLVTVSRRKAEEKQLSPKVKKLRGIIKIDEDIDFFTDREPHANPTSELFELSERGNIVMYLSAISIKNIYYIVRKFLGHKKALEVVEALVEMTEIVGTTKQEVVQVLKNDFKDF